MTPWGRSVWVPKMFSITSLGNDMKQTDFQPGLLLFLNSLQTMRSLIAILWRATPLPAPGTHWGQKTCVDV